MCGIAHPASLLKSFYLRSCIGRIEPWQGLYRQIFKFRKIFSCGIASPYLPPIWLWRSWRWWRLEGPPG